MVNSQGKLARAYATLSSLRKNIDQEGYNVPEKYVREYNATPDKLDGINIDTSEFRIPDSEVNPRITQSYFITSEKVYSEEKYVDKPYLLTKLDAILGYFKIITSDKPKRIGFSTPDNQ